MSALAWRETRGLHRRDDYPSPDADASRVLVSGMDSLIVDEIGMT
ncbi:hypothetical protein [Caballeronia ptereochthonis]|nr:hypothetical protein [Caballeronia ptereochthonis]